MYQHCIVIDDDPIALLICQRLIETNGIAKVVSTFHGAYSTITQFEKWSRAGSEMGDLIIIDIMLPEMTGWDLLRNLQPIFKQVQKLPDVLMLSATFDPDDANKVSLYNLNVAYAAKPLSIEVIEGLATKKNDG